MFSKAKLILSRFERANDPLLILHAFAPFVSFKLLQMYSKHTKKKYFTIFMHDIDFFLVIHTQLVRIIANVNSNYYQIKCVIRVR